MEWDNWRRRAIGLGICALVIGAAVFGIKIYRFSNNRGAFLPTEIHRSLTQLPDWLNTSRALTANDLSGRILIVDFWTYCCVNCLHVAEELKGIEQEFGDKVTVLGVHSGKFENEKDRENIRQAVLRYGIDHPVIDDHEFKLWKRFGVTGWPTVLLITPDGEVEASLVGENNADELRLRVRSLLKRFDSQIKVAALPLSPERLKTPPSLLRFPGKIIYAPKGEGGPIFFVSDSGHNRILAVRPDSGKIVFEVGGSSLPSLKNGTFTDARFSQPQGLLYRDEVLYVADRGNHAIRKVDLKSRLVSTIAGTGHPAAGHLNGRSSARTTALSSPWDLAFYPSDHEITIAMAGNHQLWSYDLNNDSIGILAGSGVEGISDGGANEASLAQPSGLATKEDRLYFVDSETSSLRLLRHGFVTTLIGLGLFDFGFKDGIQGNARMQHPLGIFVDGDNAYLADTFNHSIRRYDIRRRTLETLAGNGKRGKADGSFAQSTFNEPSAITGFGAKLYVTDANNQSIRVLDLKDKRVRTFGIGGPAAPALREISRTLPNIREAADIEVASDLPVNVRLSLPSDWRINDSAPSRLSLFKVNATAIDFLHDFNRDALKTLSVQLPSLQNGENYRIQGTFYYCREEKGSLCLIQSYDQTLHAKQSASAQTIDIGLKAVGP